MDGGLWGVIGGSIGIVYIVVYPLELAAINCFLRAELL